MQIGDFLWDGKRGRDVTSGDPVTLRKVERVLTPRLLAEIQLLKRLSHPHILRYRECVPTTTHLYLVSDYCNGGSLDSFLETVGSLSHVELKFYMRQLRDALRYLTDLKITPPLVDGSTVLVLFNKPRTSLRYDYRDVVLKLVVDEVVGTRSDLCDIGVVLQKMIAKGVKTSYCFHLQDLLQRLSRTGSCSWESFFDHPYLVLDDVVAQEESEVRLHHQVSLIEDYMYSL